MTPRRIELEIGRLVLEGLTPRQAAAVESAVRRGLPAALGAERRAPLTARRVQAEIDRLVSSELRR